MCFKNDPGSSVSCCPRCRSQVHRTHCDVQNARKKNFLKSTFFILKKFLDQLKTVTKSPKNILKEIISFINVFKNYQKFKTMAIYFQVKSVNGKILGKFTEKFSVQYRPVFLPFCSLY